METIRTFIAIHISEELQRAFGALIEEMRRLRGAVKWVNPDSVHLTLKFLGNITPQQIEQVSAGIEKACEGISSCVLKTGRKGAFPSLKRPRVFWIGLEEVEANNLLEIQSNIEAQMETLGFRREERPFRPHLTVGRVRNPSNMEGIIRKFLEYPFPEIQFSVNAVHVMRSDLTPRGALYTVQKTISLLT